jgi:hypothetical protein
MELMDCTETLLREISDKRFKQKAVAQTYWYAIRSTEETDWAKVNGAIIERWSVSGLDSIKSLAWSGKCFTPIKGG